MSMGFSRQEYWSGLPLPSPGNLPEPAIEPTFPALQADCLLPTREAQELPCVPAISLLSIYPKERKTGTQYPKERKAGTQTCNLYTQVHSSIIHNGQNVAAAKSHQWCLTQQLPWIFMTQGSTPLLSHLLHWQADSLPLAPPGKPHIWELIRGKWVTLQAGFKIQD